MAKTQTVYKFKRGENFHLDSIYNIQGLAGGDWWEKTGEDIPEHIRGSDTDMGELLICTRDVKITIVVETPNAEITGG